MGAESSARKVAAAARTYGLVAACLLFVAASSFAIADEPDYAPGAWHYKAVSCVDTTIVSVTARIPGDKKTLLHDIAGAGARVDYATGLGIAPLFPGGHASIVTYEGEPANEVMALERPGDRVQVCFLGGPAPTGYCDPDKDPRGRHYRIYDYGQRRQYTGFNAEHVCGGA